MTSDFDHLFGDCVIALWKMMWEQLTVKGIRFCKCPM